MIGLNGAGSDVLSGWEIVQTNGLTLIGRPVDGCPGDEAPFAMDPVYELKIQPMIDPRSGRMVGCQRIAMPLFLLDIRRTLVPSSALRVAVERLSKSERTDLARAVKIADEILSAMRSAETGIVVAGAGTKLPPPPGGQ